MIQLNSSVFFILRSAVQTYSQYSTSEISTVVGGYQAHFVDGKTEARSDGAQQQSQTTEHGNSSLAARMEQGSSLTVPSQCPAIFWVCLEMLSYTSSVQVLNLAGSCKGRKEQAGSLNQPSNAQAHTHTQITWHIMREPGQLRDLHISTA